MAHMAILTSTRVSKHVHMHKSSFKARRPCIGKNMSNYICVHTYYIIIQAVYART